MPPTIGHFDDPINPHGWVLEPTLRRLQVTFPALEWAIRPTVMVETWDTYTGTEVDNGRQGMAATCAQISERTGMPIDEYLWFDNPPSSSTVACRTIAAAKAQGKTVAAQLLRALREATFIRRMNISDDAQLRSIVATVPDLNADAVWEAVDDGTAEKTLVEHRQTAAELDVAGVTHLDDRLELPTLVVTNGTESWGLSGRHDFATYRDAITDITDLDPNEESLTVQEVLNRFSSFGWISITELSELVEEPYNTAKEQAVELVDEGEAVEWTFASESFWRKPAFAEDNEDE